MPSLFKISQHGRHLVDIQWGIIITKDPILIGKVWRQRLPKKNLILCPELVDHCTAIPTKAPSSQPRHRHPSQDTVIPSKTPSSQRRHRHPSEGWDLL